MNNFKDSPAKWDPKLLKYLPFMVPKGASIFEEDMDKEIKCANCGNKLIYGEGYTSRTIHTRFGMAYMVCTNCYADEIKAERL